MSSSASRSPNRAPSRGGRGALNLALPSLAVLICGCSFLIDVDADQCVEDVDCSSAGLAGRCEQGVCVEPIAEPPPADSGMPDGGEQPPGPQSCFASMRCDDDKICWKDQCVLERDVERFICDEPPGEQTETVRFEMQVVEFVTEQPPADLVVLACRTNDVGCADPEGRFVDEEGTGEVVLDLPYGFSGFLDVASSDALPALWYFTQPLTRPTRPKPLRVASEDTLTILAATTRLTPKADTGIVILEAFDCSNTAVGGIYFAENTEDAIPFFIVNSIPNRNATVSVFNEQTAEAPGGFLNAPPGFTLFSARIGRDGPLLGEYNANVRASTVTYLDIHP